MSVVEWLLGSDPAIRWEVMRYALRVLRWAGRAEAAVVESVASA